MSNTQKFFIRLAIIVIGFYLGLTYLPQLVGTCLDGECGFTVGEIILSFAIPLAFIALPVVLEMTLYRQSLSQALSSIGITRFSWGGINTAVTYLVPLILFFPVFSLLTSSSVSLKPNWPWLIINIILVNGLAEEIMMRGFVFRHLREGRSFWQAAWLSTLYFAGYHLPLILTVGPVVGFIAVIVAFPVGFLTAYLYERGSNTIWGAGLLHAVNNGLVMMFVFPATVQPAASSLYLLLGILVSALLLVRAYRAGYERTMMPKTSEPVVVPV